MISKAIIISSQSKSIQYCSRKFHSVNGTNTILCHFKRTTVPSLSTTTSTSSTSVLTKNKINNSVIILTNNLLPCHYPPSTMYFSSMPSPSTNEHNDDDDDNKNEMIIIPSNLKFDHKAISTPIYGLDKIIDDDAPANNDDGNKSETNSEEDNIENENDDDDKEEEDDYDIEEQDDKYNNNNNDDDDDDDDYQDTLYSLAEKPEPLYVTPLPQRLHVKIQDLIDNIEVGSIHLSPYIFGQDPIRTDILHRCVIYQRNKKRGRRNNGARTKTVSTKSGSGKKMRNQKGGGVARAGHKRAAHWRGGAKAHGPKGNDQNYETKLNRKVRMMGVRMALSQKLKEGNLIVVNSFEGLETYKTKVLGDVLDNVGDIGGRYGCTAYIIDHVPEEEEELDDGTLKGVNGVHINLQVASGNISKVKVRNQKFVNVYDILKHEKLVCSLSALGALEERYAEE